MVSETWKGLGIQLNLSPMNLEFYFEWVLNNF